ncbi:MAG TPA: phage integrase N-terminal SAM-like domain-containing protein, partial [Kribbellaceae bacterium]|nr:phage integrase N-terminal SAM-like domain-containing protein [Kribbellaceae bacterium]
MQPLDLPALLTSWQVALRAQRKSPRTLRSYTEGVVAYLRWCADHDRPVVMDRRQVVEFTDDMLANGAKPATATARQMGVRRFSAWLAAEGELDTDPLLGVKSPKVDI